MKHSRISFTDDKNFPGKLVEFTICSDDQAGIDNFVNVLKTAEGFNVEIQSIVEVLQH